MKFNLGIMPPPIVVRVGEESFELLHRYLNATERASAVEALGRGLGQAMELMGQYVLGWRDVQNDDGTPMPFEAGGQGGKIVKNLDAVMGRLPWIVQLKSLMIQYAMNGVQFQRLREPFAGFVRDTAELDAIEKEIEPFFASRSASPGVPSAG